MLENAALVAFIPVTEVAGARAFYESTLGLRVTDASPFALVVDAKGTMLRIVPVPDLQPQPFTIAGWRVPDVSSAVVELAAKGVSFNRYDGMGQRDDGIWVAPDGSLVAWFTDPFGNTLSLTQFANG